jgi:antitoxin HicB
MIMEKNLDYYAKLPYTIILEQYDDADTPYWVARVAELPHCVITGDTPMEALEEIEKVKLEWIESNLEDGLPIPEPKPHKYSGQIRLRIPPSLHQQLAYLAMKEDVSLNQYMVSILSQSAGYETARKSQVINTLKLFQIVEP